MSNCQPDGADCSRRSNVSPARRYPTQKSSDAKFRKAYDDASAALTGFQGKDWRKHKTDAALKPSSRNRPWIYDPRQGECSSPGSQITGFIAAKAVRLAGRPQRSDLAGPSASGDT